MTHEGLDLLLERLHAVPGGGIGLLPAAHGVVGRERQVIRMADPFGTREAVVVDLGDGVELVVVAAGAVDGEPGGGPPRSSG